RNLYKSTQAAAQYLNQLYDMLKDWLLVVAAYNCGPGGVLKAINASGSNNFWDLQKYLPSESRKHVMKFLATAYIMERFANFFGLDKSDLNNGDDIIPDSGPAALSSADLTNTRSLQISGKYCMPVIAKFLSMDINELNRLNPGFDKMMSGAANTYNLRLPADKMEVFKTNMNAILNESVQLMMENNRKIASAAALNAYPEAKPVPVPVPVKHHPMRHHHRKH
ncbi:MAG TPA: transglycosylase SLT domain-containing protein, partial [Chitinophagaceae bacterium]